MVLFVVLATINLFMFLIMYADKEAAKANNYRVPERKLFLCALAGGAIGGTIGMFCFHHKTKHKKFLYGFPLIAVAQIAIFILTLFS